MDAIFNAQNQNIEFSIAKLKKYLKIYLHKAHGMISMDSQRMTVNYFIVMCLLLLEEEGPEEKQERAALLKNVKQWVYEQLLPSKDSFVGGPWLARPLDYNSAQGHLASAYTGLCLLI